MPGTGTSGGRVAATRGVGRGRGRWRRAVVGVGCYGEERL